MATINEVYRSVRPMATGGACRVSARVVWPRASWPVVVGAGLLLAVTLVAAAEVMFALVHSPLRILPLGEVAGYGHGARWSDPSLRVASAVLAVVGLLLIALPLLPGRVRDHVPRTGIAWARDAAASTSRVVTRRDDASRGFAPSESSSVPTTVH